MFSYTTEERIYSLATPFSPSALAIIRTSGEGCIDSLCNAFSNPGKLSNAKSNSLLHGFILSSDGQKIDEVVLAVYKSGHGYTGEEAVEITMHGSLPAIKKLSRRLEELGFRQALKGEFTYRAFMHGRMDLTEAEAVEEIVRAKSDEAQKNALDRLGGNLRRAIEEIRARLVDILASLEVQLDYAEDEILEDWVYPKDEVEDIISMLKRIVSTYDSSRLYSQGAVVVLAGKTNAGKSSLFNALLKENRAIVSSEEGTTRDFLEALCDMDGLPVLLYDTAGLRSEGGGVEKEGMKRAKALMDKADLVLYLTDGSDADLPAADGKTVIINSKNDISGKKDGISFSSVTGDGISDVVFLVKEKLMGRISLVADVPQIESARQKDALSASAEILEKSMADENAPVDIMAMYFQDAINSLALLTGEIGSEEILEKLFSSFCLGK